MSTQKNIPTKVIVHPLVLLSVVDHYNRVARDTKKRVVGVLLGEVRKSKTGEVTADVTNTYAVPFEEDEGNSSIWFLDHNFHESMYSMFRKVNARENVVGWYSTGPKIRPADLDINQLFRRYTPNPVFVIIEVQPKEEFEIPTKGYVALEEVREDKTDAPKIEFHHITSEVGALEAEEVGVEHLLRDVKDTTISTLATKVNNKLLSLKSLISHLKEVHEYLNNVVNGRLPVNHAIIGQLQDVLNLAPQIPADSFSVKTNDSMLVIYLASMVRAVIALHGLVNNKIDNVEAERKAENPELTKKEDEKKKEEEKKKEGDAKNAKENGTAAKKEDKK